METDKRLQEQEHRAERVADKEKQIIEQLGYEKAFKECMGALYDYDKEMIYDKVLKGV